MVSRFRKVALPLLAGALILACGEDGTGPGSVLEITMLEAPATVAAGQVEELVARVGSEAGTVSGIAVTFTADEGSGTIASPVVVTEPGGFARTTWRAGTTAGSQRVTVSAEAVPDDVVLDIEVTADAPFAVEVAQDSARLFALGADTAFDAVVVDRWGNEVPGQTITWESRDTDVATVEEGGVVRALGVGTAEIVARSGELRASLFLRVVQAPARIEVTPGEATINAITFEEQLSLRSWDSGDNEIPRPEADWTTTDADVATVDGSGLVTATGVGTVDVIATAGPAADTMTVTVRQILASVEAEADTERVQVDQTLSVTGVAFDSGGVAIPGTALDFAVTEELDGTFEVMSETETTIELRAIDLGAALVTVSVDGTEDAVEVTVVMPMRPSTNTIAAGYDHSLAIRGGALWGWGGNSTGQVGDGSTDTRFVPVSLDAPGGFVAVAAARGFSIALHGDGTVWSWGRNNYGELGLGTDAEGNLIRDSIPRQIPGLTDVVAISAGGLSTSGHVLALREDGTVWSWGRNSSNQLGNGTGEDSPVPVQVVHEDGTPLTGIVHVTAGGTSSIVLHETGITYGWGSGFSGRLLTGISQSEVWPTEGALSRVIDVGFGNSHGQAVTSDGVVWGFGTNSFGANGTGGTATVPAVVTGVEDAVRVNAGNYNGVAITADGDVYAWGYGSYGQLGDGLETSSSTPVQVIGLPTTVTWVSPDYYHMTAEAGGDHYAWGRGTSGRLGTGDEDEQHTAILVPYP